jgi:hypothetical protein
MLAPRKLAEPTFKKRSREPGSAMKKLNFAGVSILLFTLGLSALAPPASAGGPSKWFHKNHPERSNPHYKNSAHRQAHNLHRPGNHKRP